MSNDPVGFLSYVRDDDKHERGRLSDLAKRLSGEVQIQTGEKFHIFQDRNDIEWGQQWKVRLEDSLDEVTFLIPIITPGFFKSPYCRKELERFLKREKNLKRGDLILPIYYVNCPILNDEEKRKADPLAITIADRQYADLRELRFEPLSSPEVSKMLAKMATQIVDALGRAQPESKRPKARRTLRPPRKRRLAAKGADQREAQVQSPDGSRGPVAKTEPPTLVVDALHRGDHSTLSTALAAANPGDRILVRPGLYREGIVIEKPVEIIGDGELGEAVIEATGKDLVLFQANMGRISNLTLRQVGGGRWYGVDISQGRLDLESCDISSQSLACVAIHGGADPRLKRNRIHDGKGGGVFVYENGQGTLEDNEIFANVQSGVEITEGGNPTLRRNRIHDGKSAGVIVTNNGLGTLEDNDIFANTQTGLQIGTGGNPTLRRNRIHDGKAGGVLVYENGQGMLEDNEISANAYSGMEIREGGRLTLRRNRISKNTHRGIWIHDNGGGIFEDNDLRGNGAGAWNVSADSEASVTRIGNQE
jgi:F-box protein 11